MDFPTRGWCYHKLRYNPVARFNRKKWQITAVYIVGSVARGTARAESDLDIAVVIRRRDGNAPKFSALKETELYHAQFRAESQKPQWSGRTVDFQFFYETDPELAGYTKIELINSR